MKRLLTAITLGVSVFIAGGLVQNLRAKSHLKTVKDHAKSIEDAVDGPELGDIEMTTKRLAIFKKILPHPPRQILVFYSTPGDAAAITAARMAGEKLAITVIERRVETVAELKAELHHMEKGAVDGILHIPDNWVDGRVDLIFHEAREKKIPTMTFRATYVTRGALAACKMRASEPTAARYYLILNLETAKRIGITFPPQALKRADEIIDRHIEKGDDK